MQAGGGPRTGGQRGAVSHAPVLVQVDLGQLQQRRCCEELGLHRPGQQLLAGRQLPATRQRLFNRASASLYSTALTQSRCERIWQKATSQELCPPPAPCATVSTNQTSCEGRGIYAQAARAY